MTTHRGSAGTLPPPAWRRREDEFFERIVQISRAMSEVLGVEQNITVRRRIADGDYVSAVTALVSWHNEHPRQHAALKAIRRDLLHLTGEVRDHDLAVHAKRLMDAGATVRRFATLSSTRQLVDDVCEQLVRGGGFSRAVLSRVEAQTWRPWMGHFLGGELDASWFDAWVDRSIPLDEMVVETDVMSAHRPAVVADTENSRVYQPIIVEAGRSSSYVVAPVIVDGEVVGFFHADHGPDSRRVNNIDRDVLWTLAQGFGLAYGRLTTAERYEGQRARLRDALSSAQRLLSDPVGMVELGYDAPPAARAHARGSGSIDSTAGPASQPARGEIEGLGEDPLTDRELEVLELMAVGATNARIADELVVSQSTVKSHVRHILRKLGAVNRAQAIARFLGSAPHV